MYSPRVIARNLAKLESLWKLSAREHSLEEVDYWVDRLKGAVDDKGNQTRPLAAEETEFIRSELLMVKCSFDYWSARYCFINKGGNRVERMGALLESQKLIIKKMGELEDLALDQEEELGFSDGILINILKARQLGASTISQAANAHRLITRTNVFSLVAADVPEQTAYIFDMLERVVDGLPWWMCPGVLERVKNTEIKFDTGSNVWTGSGKSVRGVEGKRGQLGRGKTLSVVTLSEISTWDDPGQIEDALLPGVPIDSQVLVFKESTAKGRNNWWHQDWKLSKEGVGRFNAVFIPWYAEKEKYRLPVRDPNWVPSTTTLEHAKKCEETSTRWMGHQVTLTREQLYWYEQTRKTYEVNDKLSQFLEEYCADDEEAFQFAGRGIFPALVLEAARRKARPLAAVIDVLPNAEVFSPGASPFDPNIPIPPGMGFKVVNPRTWEKWRDLDDYLGYLLVWEGPQRGERYVVGVDVSDGVGQDRSVVEVLRVGTLERQDEEVAQFVSDKIDAIGLAAFVDVIGRFYKWDEDRPALAAVEMNSHGLATIAELSNHLGYWHQFVWRYEDAADPRSRLSKKLGWYTSVKTRPMILSRLLRALKHVDPLSGYPDCRVNSPITISELADFRVEPEEELWEASAALGSHDDTVMALAIAIHVAQTTHMEEGEPLDETRRRLNEERARKEKMAEVLERRRDYQNTDCTAEEMLDGRADGMVGFDRDLLEGLEKDPEWGSY